MRPYAILAFLCILALNLGLMLRAAQTDSLTYDEKLHLDSALEWWSQGQSPSDPFNPPLSKLPSYLLSRLGIDILSDPFARLPRLTTILLSQVLLIIVFSYSYSIYKSYFISLTSTLFLSFEPLFLAQGHLVTTDLMSTLTFFLAIITLHKPIFPITLGLLAGTKIILLPALLLYITISHLTIQPIKFNPKSIILTVLYSLLTIHLIFGFRSAPVLNLTPPLPLGGFITTVLHAASASLNPKFISTRQFIYFGEVRGTGWYSYPLVAFLLKTSPLLLFLVFIGFFQLFKIQNSKFKIQLLTPALSILAVIVIGRYSTGARHLLPMYPFLAILSARTLYTLNFHSGIKLIVFCFLFSVHFFNLFITTDYLSYFNPLIGAQRGGQILADSNLDWGQSLYRLAFSIDHSEFVYCSLFSPRPPKDYGLNCIPLPPATLLTPKWASGKTLLISRTTWYTGGYSQTFLKNLTPQYLAHSTHLLFNP